jgi:RecB family exonuclease
VTRRIGEVRRRDGLLPLTVVCGSAAAAAYLRRAVTRVAGGLALVDFTTIHQLASGLAAPSLAVAGVSGADETEVLRIVGSVLAQSDEASYFARIRSMPGLPRALRRAFKDLREARVTPRQVGTLDGEGPAELAALYARYLESLAATARADDASLYEAAAAALADPAALPSAWVGLYGLYDLPGTQRLFVEALARGRAVDAFVPGPPDAAYSEFTRQLFAGLGCAEERCIADGVPAPGTAAATAVEIVSVEDAAAERREVLRRVVAAAQADIAFREVAVVHPDAGWRGLFVESLEARGIPVAARVRRPAPATRVLSAFLSCVAPVSGPPLERAAVVDLAAAAASLGRGDASLAARWDRLSRDARVVAGVEQWHGRLIALPDRSAATAVAVRDLLVFVDEVEGLRLAARELDTWPELAAWLAEALKAIGVPDDDASLSAVLRLARLADIEPRAGIDALAAVARDILADRSEKLGSLGRAGVAVVSPEQLRGLRFRVVLVGGLVEGLFPARPSPDPLLDDEARAQLSKLSGARLSTVSLRAAESDLLFALTCDAASEGLVLLRARSRDGSGAPQLPSRHLVDLCRKLSGERLPFSAVDTPGEVGGRVTRVAASQVPHPGWPGEVPGVDERDVDAAALMRLQAGGDRALTAAYLGAVLGAGHAARRSAALRSRRDPGLTAWDGLVSDPALADAVLGRELSVSAVEDYLGCPFVFYAHHVLRASAVEEPEEAFEATSLDVGSLVHGVLERVFTRLRDEPVPDRARALELLDEAVDEEFALGELQGRTGYPLAWRGRRRQLAHDLSEAVRTDPCWDDDLRPDLFEWTFGRDVPGPSIEVLGRELVFRGRVDRIDRDGGGRRVRLLDYKTGKGKVEQKHLEAGEDLQLPVYRLAAGALSPAPEDVACAFRFVTRAGGFRNAGLPGDLASTTRQLAGQLSAFVTGVQGGLFPRRHGGDRCRWCDLSYACGARTPRDADKLSDPRLQAGSESDAEGDA